MDGGEGKSEGATAGPMETLSAIAAAMFSSKLLSSSDAPPPPSCSFLLLLLLPGGRLLDLFRRFLLLSLHAILSSLLLLLSLALSHLPSSSSPAGAVAAAPDGTSATDRALAHILSTVSLVPVASRKYELVRSLAERILDDNLRLGAAAGLDDLNRAALSVAFSRTVRSLEAATASAVSATSPADSSLDMIFGAVRSGMRRFAVAVAKEGEVMRDGGGASAVKLAAEALWLGQKMAQCGTAAEAVARWGAAAGLGRVALSAEPRLQVALVRVSGQLPFLPSPFLSLSLFKLLVYLISSVSTALRRLGRESGRDPATRTRARSSRSDSLVGRKGTGRSGVLV